MIRVLDLGSAPLLQQTSGGVSLWQASLCGISCYGTSLAMGLVLPCGTAWKRDPSDHFWVSGDCGGDAHRRARLRSISIPLAESWGCWGFDDEGVGLPWRHC